MATDDLEEKAAELGFRPVDPSPRNDVNKTLAEVVESHEARFWAAFPVMLANAVEGGEFNYEAANASLPENERKFLKLLIFVSLGLYESLGFRAEWTKSLFRDFPARLTGNFRDKFKAGSELELGRLRIPAGQFRENFDRFFKKSGATVKSTSQEGEKLDLELAVSRIFTLKQKELFLKKLRGKRMTKTEKEYFSRVVKKKAQALANADLHSLARKVLGL